MVIKKEHPQIVKSLKQPFTNSARLSMKWCFWVPPRVTYALTAITEDFIS